MKHSIDRQKYNAKRKSKKRVSVSAEAIDRLIADLCERMSQSKQKAESFDYAMKPQGSHTHGEAMVRMAYSAMLESLRYDLNEIGATVLLLKDAHVRRA